MTTTCLYVHGAGRLKHQRHPVIEVLDLRLFLDGSVEPAPTCQSLPLTYAGYWRAGDPADVYPVCNSSDRPGRLVARLGGGPGDTNLDGLIDEEDLTQLLRSRGRNATFPPQWRDGDFDADGAVTTSDLLEVLSHLGDRLRICGSATRVWPLYVASRMARSTAAIRADQRE